MSDNRHHPSVTFVTEYLDLALPMSRLLSPQLATAAAAESAAVTAAAVVTAASGMVPPCCPPMPPSSSPAPEVGPIGPGSVAVIMEEEDKKMMKVTVNSNCGDNGDNGDKEGDGSADQGTASNAANNLGIGQ